MLVLSRNLNEQVMIGDDIVVEVVDIRGSKVRLGITAPKDISVHRKEVYEAIQKEKEITVKNIAKLEQRIVEPPPLQKGKGGTVNGSS